MILLKMGMTEKSEDQELTEQVGQFKNQDGEVKRLTDSVTKYVEALDTVRRAESDLFHTWSLNIQDWNNLESFLQNAEAVKERRGLNVEALNREVVLPLQTYKQQFQEVKARVDKLERRRIEADRLAFRLRAMKISEKVSSVQLAAAEKAASSSEDAYTTSLKDIKRELPLLYGVRREFFTHSLYGLFAQQNNVHADLSYIYRDMSEYVLVKLKQD